MDCFSSQRILSHSLPPENVIPIKDVCESWDMENVFKTFALLQQKIMALCWHITFTLYSWNSGSNKSIHLIFKFVFLIRCFRKNIMNFFCNQVVSPKSSVSLLLKNITIFCGPVFHGPGLHRASAVWWYVMAGMTSWQVCTLLPWRYCCHTFRHHHHRYCWRRWRRYLVIKMTLFWQRWQGFL